MIRLNDVSQLKKEIGSQLKSPLLCMLAVFYIAILFLDGKNVHLFCDEISFLRNVASFVIYRTVEPIYTNYPTFYSYFVAVPIYIVYFICFVFFHHFPLSGLLDSRLFALVFQTDIEIWMWVGRIISILFAAGILVLVYSYCVTRLTRPALMVVICLLIASPYNFYMSYARYALPDILVAFLLTIVLYIASRYIEEPNNDSLYFAGFLSGLAGSAKLNGLVTIAPLLALPWIVPIKKSQKLRLMAWICGWAMLGFFVGSPCNVLKPGIYATGFSLESEILFSKTNDFSFQWLMLALWREDPVMTTLVIIAIGFSLWRHSKKDMVFHAILIPAVIFLGGLAKRTPHYLLLLFPWLCIIIGQFFQEILKLERPKVVRFFLIAGLLGVVAYESHRLTAQLIADTRQDNRNIARAWIIKNISANEHILLDVDNVPQLSFLDIRVMPMNEYINNNAYKDIVKKYAQRELFPYLGVLPNFYVSIQDLKEQGWKYFVTADTCFDQYLQDPSGLDVVENGANKFFINFLIRRNFYLRLFQESIGIQVFKDGAGPKIYIVRIM